MIDWKRKSPEEIGTIFINHWKYLETQGKEGEKAILHEFNLSEADLTGSNLRMANLSDANLECANLRRAYLTNAITLRGEDFANGY